MKRILLLCLAAALVMSAPAPAQAQVQTCGDIQIVFRNQGLQPGGDGFIRAQGQFFAQFQAIGEDAGEIAVFGFSFGPHTRDFDETACDQQVWITGTYIPNYRADRDASDGFFIPLKTSLVPDGTYAAAVHAYDADNNELARLWAKAIVDNCDGGDGSRCDGDLSQIARQDKTPPWPILLPGDGQAMDGRHLSIEFGEAIDNFTVTLNNEDITANVTAWDGRVWDADLVPDYGPGGLAGVVAEPCTQAYHTCQVYGPAFEWNGRALTNDDVIRVEATDAAGNTAVKTIHLGSSVAGGAVTDADAILTHSVDVLRRTVAPGGQAVFSFTIENNGGGTGHPFAEAVVPAGWTHEWQPIHVVVEPGQTQVQDLVVDVPAGTVGGSYSVNATLEYQSGGATRTLSQRLTVDVDSSVAPPPEAPEQEPKGKASPAGGAFALAAIALGLLVARRAQPPSRLP